VKALFVGIGTILLVACGGDSTGPKAASVTGIFGDNDSTLTGGTLSVGFTVLDPGGLPLRGARVTWKVTPTAAALVNPSSQTSDSSGAIATAVRVGSTVGPFTVTASVNGVAPIDFHLKALDPCLYLAPYAFGDTVLGSIARTDCRIVINNQPYYYDYYRMDLPAGQQSIRIKEASSGSLKIDPYVELYRSTGPLVGWDDDIDAGVNQTSQLDVILGSGGSYVIAATSFDPDTTGPYTLTASTRPTTLAACQDAWMTPGATLTDTIRSTDCVDSGPAYSDIIFTYAHTADVIEVAERSTSVNPLLTLYHANFQLQRFDSVAANDDSVSGNPNAFISYAVPGDGWYLLQIGTATPGEIGEYTLAFSATGTLAARKSGPVDQLLPVLPSRTFRGWKKHS
jgi:hypothetical protein